MTPMRKPEKAFKEKPAGDMEQVHCMHACAGLTSACLCAAFFRVRRLRLFSWPLYPITHNHTTLYHDTSPGKRGHSWFTLHLLPLLFSFCLSFCRPELLIFSIQLCCHLFSFHLPRCAPTVTSCCEGGNPKNQEQETCVNKEVRSGNGCSTVHCQVKDMVQ